MKHTKSFWELLQNRDAPIIVLEGGSGSGKTQSVLQRIIRRAIKNQGTITSVVSETIPQLKKGAERDFLKILETENLYEQRFHNQTDRIYTFGKSKVEFFSSDNFQNILGGRRDYLFINEAIRLDWDTAYTLIRYTNIQSIIDFNPSYEFWAHTTLRTMPNVVWLHSTYKDNPHLPEMQRKLLLERGKIDKYFGDVFVEGKIGKREGLIYPEFNLVNEIPAGLDYCYGLDFGYNHPTALVRASVREKDLFWQQEIYQSHLTPNDLIEELKKKIKDRRKEIYADPSRPDLIESIAKAGFNIKQADNNVKAGIDKILNYRINITKDSVELINEVRNYRWKTDRTGKSIDEPVKIGDDACDGARYSSMGIINPKIIRPARITY